MNLTEDYLSTGKRALVEDCKQRIRAGEFDRAGAGFLTERSTTVEQLIAHAVCEDEQGPWSVEDPHTELDLARYELAFEDWEARVREELRAELKAELREKLRAELRAELGTVGGVEGSE